MPLTTDHAVTPQPRKHLQDLHRVSSIESDRSGFLRLDKNENLTGIPEGVLTDLRNLLTQECLTAYPHVAPLYQSLADHTGVEPGQVFLASGSDGAIKAVFEAYVEPHDDVLLLNPTYAMFSVYARMFQAVPVEVSYEKGPALSLKKVLDHLRPSTKLLCIANPNSPTGTAFGRSEMEQLIEAANRSGSLILVDEAYAEYYGETVADLLRTRPNLIITRTFSKALGLASVRLGYALSSEEIVAALFKVRPLYEINAMAARYGQYVMEHPELVTRHLQEVAKAKAFLEAAVARMGLAMPPSSTNFVLIDVGSREKAVRIRDFMRRQKILIKAGFEHPSMAPFIRVTIGSAEQMTVFVKVLGTALRVAELP